MSLRVCSQPGCPVLVKPGAGTCKTHTLSRHDRGYDLAHTTLRAEWQRRMDRGVIVRCWRCGTVIDPNAWDLGHDDGDRTIYRGPECRPCNRGTSTRR